MLDLLVIAHFLLKVKGILNVLFWKRGNVYEPFDTVFHTKLFCLCCDL